MKIGVPAHEYFIQFYIVEKVQFIVYCKRYVLILVNYVLVYAVGNVIIYIQINYKLWFEKTRLKIDVLLAPANEVFSRVCHSVRGWGGHYPCCIGPHRTGKHPTPLHPTHLDLFKLHIVKDVRLTRGVSRPTRKISCFHCVRTLGY